MFFIIIWPSCLAALPTLCVTFVCLEPAVNGEGVVLFWLAAFSSQKFSVSWRCGHASLTYIDGQREVCKFSLHSQDRGDNLITKHFETSTVFSMLKTTSKSFRGKKQTNHFFIYSLHVKLILELFSFGNYFFQILLYWALHMKKKILLLLNKLINMATN